MGIFTQIDRFTVTNERKGYNRVIWTLKHGERPPWRIEPEKSDPGVQRTRRNIMKWARLRFHASALTQTDNS